MKAEQSERVVLFDFDGTLGQSLGHWAFAYHESLTAHGIEVDLATALEACFNRRLSDVATHFKVKDPHALRETVWQKVKERMPLVESYPLVASTLHNLKKLNYTLGVVSNSRRGHITPVLERWSVGQLFDTVVTIEDVSSGKPNPEPIHKALSQLEATPTNAWMIGDSVIDISAGNAAGVKTIAFSPTENHQFVSTETLREARPTHVAHSYQDIIAILNPGTTGHGI
jgi:HAD superfamily hydrolase (TIGR01662 family)